MTIQYAQDSIAARAIAARDGYRSLPAMVQRAASQLASATTAAEILDARDMASVAYDASKKAARLAKAKGAHDELIARAHRTQADALEIEAAAKRRLADEYDAAQERGEVAGQGKPSKPEGYTTVADIGLTHKDIHDARQFRDAEAVDPGIIRRTLDAKLSAGEEPTKAALREAVIEAARIGIRGGSVQPKTTRNPNYVDDPAYRMMLQVLGPCRSLTEKVEAGEIVLETVLRGFLDEEHRQRAMRDIEAARDFLNTILESAAHAH